MNELPSSPLSSPHCLSPPPASQYPKFVKDEDELDVSMILEKDSDELTDAATSQHEDWSLVEGLELQYPPSEEDETVDGAPTARAKKAGRRTSKRSMSHSSPTKENIPRKSARLSSKSKSLFVVYSIIRFDGYQVLGATLALLLGGLVLKQSCNQ